MVFLFEKFVISKNWWKFATKWRNSLNFHPQKNNSNFDPIFLVEKMKKNVLKKRNIGQNFQQKEKEKKSPFYSFDET